MKSVLAALGLQLPQGTEPQDGVQGPLVQHDLAIGGWVGQLRAVTSFPPGTTYA